MASKYIFEFDVTPELLEKLSRIEFSTKSLHQQYLAVNAGIGHDLFFKTWPNTTLHIYRQMRDSSKIWSSSDLRGQLTLSATEEFAVYDYFCDVLEKRRIQGGLDDMGMMLDAWYKTNERFDEIMPFGCFLNALRG